MLASDPSAGSVLCDKGGQGMSVGWREESMCGKASVCACIALILHTEQRWGVDQAAGVPRKWYSAISEWAGQLPELNVQYSQSSAAILSLGSGPGHMCKPLVCIRGHGCGCRPSWSGGNSPPPAPPEGRQAWSQRGGCPEGLRSPLSVSAPRQYKSRFTNFEPVL